MEYRYTLDEYKAQEFDESCLTRPIPKLPMYTLEEEPVMHEDLDDSEGRWYHAWELPPDWLPE